MITMQLSTRLTSACVLLAHFIMVSCFNGDSFADSRNAWPYLMPSGRLNNIPCSAAGSSSRSLGNFERGNPNCPWTLNQKAPSGKPQSKSNCPPPMTSFPQQKSCEKKLNMIDKTKTCRPNIIVLPDGTAVPVDTIKLVLHAIENIQSVDVKFPSGERMSYVEFKELLTKYPSLPTDEMTVIIGSQLDVLYSVFELISSFFGCFTASANGACTCLHSSFSENETDGVMISSNQIKLIISSFDDLDEVRLIIYNLLSGPYELYHCVIDQFLEPFSGIASVQIYNNLFVPYNIYEKIKSRSKPSNCYSKKIDPKLVTLNLPGRGCTMNLDTFLSINSSLSKLEDVLVILGPNSKVPLTVYEMYLNKTRNCGGACQENPNIILPDKTITNLNALMSAKEIIEMLSTIKNNYEEFNGLDKEASQILYTMPSSEVETDGDYECTDESLYSTKQISELGIHTTMSDQVSLPESVQTQEENDPVNAEDLSENPRVARNLITMSSPVKLKTFASSLTSRKSTHTTKEETLTSKTTAICPISMIMGSATDATTTTPKAAAVMTAVVTIPTSKDIEETASVKKELAPIPPKIPIVPTTITALMTTGIPTSTTDAEVTTQSIPVVTPHMYSTETVEIPSTTNDTSTITLTAPEEPITTNNNECNTATTSTLENVTLTMTEEPTTRAITVTTAATALSTKAATTEILSKTKHTTISGVTTIKPTITTVTMSPNIVSTSENPTTVKANLCTNSTTEEPITATSSTTTTITASNTEAASVKGSKKIEATSKITSRTTEESKTTITTTSTKKAGTMEEPNPITSTPSVATSTPAVYTATDKSTTIYTTLSATGTEWTTKEVTGEPTKTSVAVTTTVSGSTIETALTTEEPSPTTLANSTLATFKSSALTTIGPITTNPTTISSEITPSTTEKSISSTNDFFSTDIAPIITEEPDTTTGVTTSSTASTASTSEATTVVFRTMEGSSTTNAKTTAVFSTSSSETVSTSEVETTEGSSSTTVATTTSTTASPASKEAVTSPTITTATALPKTTYS